MLLGAGRKEAPLSRQLLGQGADVVGLEPAAASDVANAGVVRITGVFMHVPTGQDPGLQTCRGQNIYKSAFRVYMGSRILNMTGLMCNFNRDSPAQNRKEKSISRF